MTNIATILKKKYKGKIDVPFNFMYPNKVFGVVNGAIDLFLVSTEDGKKGPYYHIKRFNKGSILFGFEQSNLPENTIIMARAHYDTTLHMEYWDDFIQNAQHDIEYCADQIDKWCESLTDLILITYASSDSISLEPGEEITIKDEETDVSAKHDIIWLQLNSNSSGHYLSDSSYALKQNNIFIPITKLSWCQFSDQSKITSKSSKDMMQDSLIAASILNFNHIIIETHKINIENKALFQSVKIYEKIDNNINLTHIASQNLVNLLAKSKVTTQDITSTDQTVKQCQILAQQIDVHLKSVPPDKMRLTSKEKAELLFQKSKIPTRMVFLRKNWHKQNNGLLLAFTKTGKDPVALIPNKNKGYLMYETNNQRLIPVKTKQASIFDNQAISIYKKLPTEGLTFSQFLHFGLKNQWHLVWSILFFGILVSLLGYVTPLLSQKLIDEIIPSANINQLLWFAGATLTALLATFVVNIARNFVLSKFRNDVGYQMEASLWDRLINLPMSYHKKESSTETFVRASRFHQMRQYIGEGSLEALMLGFFGLANIFLLFHLNPLLGMLGVAAGALYSILTYILAKIKIKYDTELLAVERQQSNIFFQMVNGVAKIRITGSEVRAYVYWVSSFSKMIRATISSEKISIIYDIIQDILPHIFTLILYISVALLVVREDMSTGTFVAFSVAFIALLNSIGSIMGTVISLSMISPMVDNVSLILREPLRSLMAEEELAHFKGEIQIGNLSFRYYPDTPLIFNNLNLTINAGEFVAIVGSSGAGKSTLIRLLLGLDSPTEGTIYYDGKDIENLELNIIRKQFGAVLQNEQLFIDSIYKNIVGANKASEDEVMEVVEAVGLDKDLEDMPMGLNTLLGIGGGGLSGGQKQRILIARAIINKPKILLLDEATSAMDNQSQKIIIDTLEKLKATRIVIAHRLSTIINADKIIYIDNGIVSEEGTYDELMALKGQFYNLAKQQIL